MAVDRHVPLDRRFTELGDEKQMEEAATRSLLDHMDGRRGGISWEEIYADGRSSVILGEAGSGKSQEMKHQCDELQSKQRPTAYVDLVTMLQRSSPELTSEASRLLDRWRRGSEVAWLFLDSVDESKLAQPSDFERALRSVRAWLGSEAGRARFILSSRISEWRPTADLNLVREYLVPTAATSAEVKTARSAKLKRRSSSVHDTERVVNSKDVEGKSEAEPIRVLTLSPLSVDQAKTYLTGKSAVDSAFWAAVDEADAWDFMTRPLDADGMFTLWRRRGRLGTWQEVVEAMVDLLLDDPRDRSALPRDKAREGAEHLAACMAFSKSVVVLLGDATPSDAQGVLTLRECLPQEWSPAERDLLLQRPLFAPAAYGRLRFHHRTHGDYLAARWLAKLMRHDCQHAELRHLLFSQRADRLTLRPALIPVAAWLATVDAGDTPWQRRHRQDLLDAAPWVFLSQGDPRSLPLDYRTEVLRRTAERFKGRGHVNIDWDGSTLKRFADTALADPAGRWIADPTIPDDVRADYVALVKYGRLHGAMPAVVTLAIDDAASEYLRASALICIAAIGGPAERLSAVSAFAAPQHIPLRLGVQLVGAVYPHVVDERGLFELLARFDTVNTKMGSSSFYTLDAFFEREIDCDRAPLVLRELGTFVLDADAKLDKSKTWALTWLAPLIATAMEAPKLDAQAQETILFALRLIEQAREQHLHQAHRVDDALKRVADRSLAHPWMRREWFWNKVAAHRQEHSNEPERHWHIDDYYAPIKIHANDLPWWTADIRERLDRRDRLFALRMALHLSGARRRWPSWLPPVEILAAGSTSGPLRAELLGHIKYGVTGPWYRLRSLWLHKWSRRWFLRELPRPLFDRYFRHRNCLQLWWGKERMERGLWWGGVWFVVEKARRGASSSQWGDHDLDQVTALFGGSVVRCAVAGAEVHWREHAPALPSEKSERNQTNAHTILGLVSLRAAWNEHGKAYFETLDETHSLRAARYALNELNGLPPWFGALTRAHPGPVGATLASAIQGEWQTIPTDAQFGSPTLQRLGHSDFDPPPVCLAALRSLVEGATPANTSVLRDALQIAMSADTDCAKWLMPRAKSALDDTPLLSEAHWPWLMAAFMLDADSAFDWLVRRLGDKPSSERRQVAESLGASLLNRRQHGIVVSQPDYMRPRLLRRFLPWLIEHVRPEDDIEHDGIYSPGMRDDAERMRSVLVEQLASDPSAQAAAVLAELAADDSMRAYRDYLLRLIDLRRSREADNFRLEAVDVAMLLAEKQRIPRNRADLFHTAWTRLLAFKEQVESAENTIRHQTQPRWQEHDFQLWLQRHMETARANKYTVPREAEVDPGKFPDLRFESPLVDGAISVEVKVATFAHWSYAKLTEHLHQQLVGQYLRAGNARYGVYLLFRADATRTWRMEDGTALDWTQLLDRLSEEAASILGLRQDIERLEVLGVDVTHP
jgi:hypothetical protein